ncbi:39S ribosomal protein L52, mitochondrial-like [Anneissia japonica]|uniref:39S ribosomal protein L52, mitochondrial-like n=1 Tax=Anneissia japonica TaxID=1529436 RepID=UPI001425659E|nr:39S ribosomal protein L52, mitochondrial-like [Anneissia japonica]XP_033096277.1 39S ribosomal protein L52, mitochondrial-like [Anneissia japonica]
MALVLYQCTSKLVSHPLLQTARLFQTAVPVAAGRAWRESQGHARTGTEYGPLTDLPDWSFADGRPAPDNRSIIDRRETQRKIAERVNMLAKEMMAAVENTKNKEIKEKQEHELRESKKLKAKGIKWKSSNR